MKAITKKEGIHIQTNSLFITRHPQALKNFATPIGETWMGLNGKK